MTPITESGRPSPSCRETAACRDRTNLGFEVAGNVFKNICDNPIEPEGYAAYWIIKHNMFLIVHAAVATDGVSGHDVLVFGNIFGDDSCKQVFDCPETALWTADRQALFADCFPTRDRAGKPLDHRMQFNAYDRMLDPKTAEFDQDQVKVPVRFEGAIPSGLASPAEIERIFAIG